MCSAAERVSVGVTQESRAVIYLQTESQCGGGMQCSHERQRYRRIFSAPEVSVIRATLVLVRELQATECWFHSNHLFINTAIKD